MKKIKSSQLTKDFFSYKDFSGADCVREIITDVKENGDSAIIKYNKKFGDGDFENFLLCDEEIENAFNEVPPKTIEAIQKAAENIKNFAQAQLECLKELKTEQNGIILGHRIIPLERIGAYVPGGNYPLPSSALMSVIPAKVAGVKEVIVCSPRIKPATIAACKIAGADKIYRIGGAQAVAAMAYGTQSIAKVDKIVGPGNKYVTLAKKEVYGVCGIDFLAGPSEVMIIADKTANPDFIAADMLAQAEHDKEAQAILITDSEELAAQVEQKVQEFLNTLETADIASISIENSIIILVDDINEAVEIADKKAPEHLEIFVENSQSFAQKCSNFGSIFIGNYSAEVFGDYCSGTNHVLPTNSIARYSGGLSVFDFVKIATYQEISENAAKENLCAIAATIAATEGLMGHKLSAGLRWNN